MGRKASNPELQVAARRTRFLRVASSRTQKVLDDLAKLKNCARKDLYDYSGEDIEKILSVLQQEIDSLRRSFQGEPHGFSLSEDNNDKNEV